MTGRNILRKNVQNKLDELYIVFRKIFSRKR
jgi:hypothetical protein